MSKLITLIGYAFFAFLMIVLFLNDYQQQGPNREGSETDYETYYDGCTDPFISC